MTKLTKRQTEVLELIREQVEAKGSPPTRAEIARQMGFRSPNAAEDHLRALAKKGVIELVPGTSRGIRLLKDVGVPVVGSVAAGQPIMAEQNIECCHKIDRNMFKDYVNYLLKVKGDSMKNAGIFNGDLLAVHSTTDIRNGQIVVARVDNEVTVKRFHREGDIVTLFAENQDYQPIKVDLREKHLAIEGIAVGIIRSL